MPMRRPPGLNAAETALWLLEHRTDYDAGTGCRIWTGAVGPQGYGNVSYGGRTHPAHRFMKIALHGAPPIKAMVASHSLLCPRLCVAPEHIEWRPKPRRRPKEYRCPYGT